MAPAAMDEYSDEYPEDSEADEDYDRGLTSPALAADYSSSPTESDPPHSNQRTPTTFTRAGHSSVSPTGLIAQWTSDQCADYVAALGLDQYADSFVDEGIDGEALISILHEDLKDMGIASMGHRLTILKGVYDVKIKQNVAIEPDHYVPLSADANAPDSHATQDDIVRIINQIKLRDERLLAAEEELRTMKEELSRVWEDNKRLREDVLPIIRMAKDKNQPLPTPEGVSYNESIPSPHPGNEPKSAPGLTRKYSAKKIYLGGQNGKMPSPTIHEATSLDPSAAVKAASSQLTASVGPQGSQQSPRMSQQPSPTSPPYASQQTSARYFPRSDGGPPSSRYAASSDESWSHSSSVSSTAAQQSQQQPSSARQQQAQQTPQQQQTPDPTGAPGAMEFMKSFRVSMDEPCHKVLPVALKKYHIQDDWRQYSLYIVHGDQERCLGLEERPLILFKQLASEGKKPMFMLRKHATPQEGFNHPRVADGAVGTGGPSSVASTPGPSVGGMGDIHAGGGSSRVQSYASSAQLPGGQF